MPCVPGGMLSAIGRWLPSLAASPWLELLLPLFPLAPPSEPAGWSPCCFFLSLARFLAPFGMAEFEGGAAPARSDGTRDRGGEGEEDGGGGRRFVLLWREGISSFLLGLHRGWVKFERDLSIGKIQNSLFFSGWVRIQSLRGYFGSSNSKAILNAHKYFFQKKW